MSKLLHKLRVFHACRNRDAGNTRSRYLQQYRADLKPIPNVERRTFEVRYGQIVAERSRPQVSTDASRPPLVIWHGEEVNCLIEPAVIFGVDDGVAFQAQR